MSMLSDRTFSDAEPERMARDEIPPEFMLDDDEDNGCTSCGENKPPATGNHVDGYECSDCQSKNAVN
jgi:hypothetical protein